MNKWGLLIILLFVLSIWAASANAHYHYLGMPPGEALTGFPHQPVGDGWFDAAQDDSLWHWSSGFGFDRKESRHGLWPFAVMTGGSWAPWWSAPGMVKDAANSPSEKGFALFFGKNRFLFLRDRSSAEGHVLLPWFPFSFPGWDWQRGDFLWADGNTARKEGPFWWCRADIGDTNGDPARDGDDPGAAVPLPAAIWLMGSGLIGLVGLHKWFGKR